MEKHAPEKEYNGLILTVGFSPQPLILSISAINPRRIAFLYTPEVQGFIERIRNQTGYTRVQTDLLQIDGTDVKGIYDKTWQFSRDNWGEFKNIAVDITGGKTSMAAGAALATAGITS